MITLTSDYLQVRIANKGAELQSIFNKEHQIEYLWNGDPVFWNKRAPILFPIVGQLKENTYKYNTIPKDSQKLNLLLSTSRAINHETRGSPLREIPLQH